MTNSNRSEIVDLNEYQKICAVKDLKNNEGTKFFVNNVEIAVFLVEDKIYALDNICPHQHSALIYDGFIENGCVVCPAHGWMFNLKTGRLPSGSKGLNTHPVQIIDGDVFVKVIEKKFNW